MSNPRSIKETEIWQISAELANKVENIVINLPKNEFYEIKDTLFDCMELIPVEVEETLRTGKRMDKLKAYIKASHNLQICRDKLELIRRLKLADTRELIELVDLINDRLNTEKKIFSQ
ncbi:MAG: four helix bundle protein [Candidatus Kapaibacterium sp.]